MSSQGYSQIPQHETDDGDESVTRPPQKKYVLPFIVFGVAVLLIAAGMGVFCAVYYRNRNKPEPVDGILFDRFDAFVVEDSEGSIDVYAMQTNRKDCLINFTGEFMLEYGSGETIDVYDHIFARKIGHRVVADMDCSYHITSDFNISYKDGKCPDLKNVTPAGMEPPKLENCTMYEYIDDMDFYKIYDHFWVSGRRLVAFEEYVIYRGHTFGEYHQYFIKFEEKKLPKSTFNRPKDITLVDLSKPYFPPDEDVPKTETKIFRKKAVGGTIPGKIGNRPPLESFLEEKTSKTKHRLINMLRPHSGKVRYDIVNGKLERFVIPETVEVDKRNGLDTLKEVGENDIPTSYDVRAVYGDKCPTTTTIFNQGDCGCCWAMAAANSFSDRVCIASNGTIKTSYSTQYLINCVNESSGCEGGYQDSAWNFIKNNGIVTEDCLPFTEYDGECHINECEDPSTKPEAKFLHTAYSPFFEGNWTKNEHVIQAEIMKYGSVETCFFVLPDFMLYSRGVYRHKGTGEYLGGHCVRMMGWGVDPRAGPYWIIANSWGEDWGEDGYFRVARGINDCGFEDSIAAGEVKL